jgi:predicted nuclease with TOPRIM domain
MHEQLAQRLTTLKAELEAGQKMLADLEARQAHLRDTMLRISGAIQVIEEILSAEGSRNSQPADPVALG